MAAAAAELTDKEAKVAQMLGDAWNEYMKLPIEHPMGRGSSAALFMPARTWCWPDVAYGLLSPPSQ